MHDRPPTPNANGCPLPSRPTGEPKSRVVAIVGRPNVGKSATFNRLVGRRIAIVHHDSGVTRDRLLQRAYWNGQPFDLVDTGGLTAMADEQVLDPIATGIHRQARAAIQDAAIAILVVDATQGLHPMDEEVVALLRRNNLPALVAVNKCDVEHHETILPDFARLGLPVFPVSALHNRGFDPLMQSVLAELPATSSSNVEKPLKVAIVGHPNVGKSSFVNRILGDQRVIVSDVPGTTRDRIEVPFSLFPLPGGRASTLHAPRHYLFIDTAGMRRMGRVDEAVERYSHFRADDSIRDADIVVLVLDALKGPTDQDKHIAASIRKADKGCMVVANKWDLVSDLKPAAYTRALRERLPFLSWCPIVCASAKTGFNVRHSLRVIDQVADNIKATLPTGLLNRTLAEAVRRVSPPQTNGRRLKLFYATQVGVVPVRVRIFCNDPKRIRPNYREYLSGFFRRQFDLEGAPLILQFRGRHARDLVHGQSRPHHRHTKPKP